MGQLNRRDDEIDNGSSSGTMDEGRRAVAVDEVVREEALAWWRKAAVGWQTEECGVSRLVERGFGGLGVRMGKMEGMGGGTMA